MTKTAPALCSCGNPIETLFSPTKECRWCGALTEGSENRKRALEPDAGHPSDGGASPPADVGDPEHRSDARSNRLASGSSALDEGGSPQRGSACMDPRAYLWDVSGRDSRPPSSSASEGRPPQCGPNSPLGGRARTPGDVAEEAWLTVDRMYRSMDEIRNRKP